MVRAKVFRYKNQKKQGKVKKGSDLIGAKLRKADLRGANLRCALLIAADLREIDRGSTDLLPGADFRDAGISGAALTGSVFLTPAQVSAAKGDSRTKLTTSLNMPDHWFKVEK